MEVKSAMDVIVAAPTAGACGGLPGAVFGAVDEMGRGRRGAGDGDAGGRQTSSSSEPAPPCRRGRWLPGRCGCRTSMAAAALVAIADGTAGQAVAAASLALQNLLGHGVDSHRQPGGRCLAWARMCSRPPRPWPARTWRSRGSTRSSPSTRTIAAMDRVGRSLPMEHALHRPSAVCRSPRPRRRSRRNSRAGISPELTFRPISGLLHYGPVHPPPDPTRRPA